MRACGCDAALSRTLAQPSLMPMQQQQDASYAVVETYEHHLRVRRPYLQLCHECVVAHNRFDVGLALLQIKCLHFPALPVSPAAVQLHDYQQRIKVTRLEKQPEPGARRYTRQCPQAHRSMCCCRAAWQQCLSPAGCTWHQPMHPCRCSALAVGGLLWPLLSSPAVLCLLPAMF
jgi:hypothetical protein